MKKTFKLTPELTCPELAGYVLPELLRHQKDDSDVNKTWLTKHHRTGQAPLMYMLGYTEARERYEFTKQDLIDLVQSLKDYTSEIHNVLGHDERDASELVDIFLTKRTPIAIEVEMERVKINPMGRRVDPMDFTQNQSSCTWEQMPATNPDGTVKGTYIFNN